MFSPKQSRWPLFFTFLTTLTHHLSMGKFSEKKKSTLVPSESWNRDKLCMCKSRKCNRSSSIVGIWIAWHFYTKPCAHSWRQSLLSVHLPFSGGWPINKDSRVLGNNIKQTDCKKCYLRWEGIDEGHWLKFDTQISLVTLTQRYRTEYLTTP